MAALCTGLLVPSSGARGNIIAYDNLGPDWTWEGGAGLWFGHYPGASMTVAQKFVPTVSGPLAGLYASIVSDIGASDFSWIIRLLDDQSNYPGAVLWSLGSEQWPVEEQTVFHLDNLSGPWLTAGVAYWIQADKPTVMGSAHSWLDNNQGYRGTRALSGNDGPWEVFDDDDVNPVHLLGLRVLVIPEPAGLSLLALGGLALLRRRPLQR
jgi:hypothetical protein